MNKMMFACLLLLSFCSHPLQAQKKKPAATTPTPAFNLKNGDVLVYDVNVNGDIYQFEVALKELRQAIVFDWTMPQKDMAGEVTLEKTALASATVYKNYFRDGEEWTLTDTSTVWLSRKNFTEGKKGGTIMTVDAAGAQRFDKKGTGMLEIDFKGKPMKVKYLELSNGKTDGTAHSLQVLDNAAQPLILQMNLGWTIVLRAVKAL